MGPFRWLESPGQLDALALSLRSLSALAGLPADYDELVAALGLGSLVVSDARHSIADWPTLARDELLVVTAEYAGIRLRDLHPRRAAIGLETSEEFKLHFEDSYLPLIDRALATGQLALAWRGWPPPHDMQWGIITTCAGHTVSGFTIGQSGGPVPLNSPAQQVYIVEEVGPPLPALGVADAFARTAWALRAQETGVWSSDLGVRTGSRAWGEWEKRLQLDIPDVQSHCGAVLPIAAARESLGRWLRGRAAELSGEAREAAVLWGDLCDNVAQRLRGTLPATGAPGPAAAGRGDATLRALREIAELDARAAEAVAPHARPVAIRPAYEPDPLQV